MSYPPNNYKEWVKALKKLGFEERRVGKGKHAYKFKHPTKKTKDYRIQRNFIIIPHKIYPTLSKGIVKQVMFFGFSLEEIKKVC
jgi:predicted RNA binding protein YcfA (HicA-like mRNA interferase family)